VIDLEIWNRKQRRFTEMCKDLDDEIIYVDDFNEDIQKVESEIEQKEPSIVLSK
jgi:hypothetical protein